MNKPGIFNKRVVASLALVLLILASGPAMAVKGDTEAATQGWALVAEGAILIDVRSAEEYAAGHIEGAINIPHTDTESLAEAIGANPQQPTVLYCGSGRRAGIAAEALESLGYTSVFNASGYEALDATRPQP